jgi:hypothetical protein
MREEKIGKYREWKRILAKIAFIIFLPFQGNILESLGSQPSLT